MSFQFPSNLVLYVDHTVTTSGSPHTFEGKWYKIWPKPSEGPLVNGWIWFMGQ